MYLVHTFTLLLIFLSIIFKFIFFWAKLKTLQRLLCFYLLVDKKQGNKLDIWRYCQRESVFPSENQSICCGDLSKTVFQKASLRWNLHKYMNITSVPHHSIYYLLGNPSVKGAQYSRYLNLFSVIYNRNRYDERQCFWLNRFGQDFSYTTLVQLSA